MSELDKIKKLNIFFKQRVKISISYSEYDSLFVREEVIGEAFKSRRGLRMIDDRDVREPAAWFLGLLKRFLFILEFLEFSNFSKRVALHFGWSPLNIFI